MDFLCNRETVLMYREVFAGSNEQPIDLDVTLPDYCPDITRILKCEILPQITARQLSGDRLNIEGSTLIRLIYANEETPGVRSCELTSAFSLSFHLKCTPELSSVFTTVQVNFANCRAVTQRRIDLHGAFTVNAQVFGRTSEEYLVGASGGGIRLKKCSIPVNTLTAVAQQVFTVNEFVPFPTGKKPAEALVRFDTTGIQGEYRILADKLMVRGEMKVDFLYLTDAGSGETDAMQISLPFSQILDMNGLSEACKCDTRLEILSTQIQMTGNSMHDEAGFEVEIHAALFASAQCTRLLTPITDAFSTAYEATSAGRPTTFLGRVDSISETFTAKSTVAVSADRIATVYHAWQIGNTVSSVCNEGHLSLNGKIRIAILYADENGVPGYLEAPVDYALSRDYNATQLQTADPELSVLSIGTRMLNSEEMELRVELRCRAEVNAATVTNVLTDIQLNENTPKAVDRSCAMTIYYANAGENLWDIARHYNTDEAEIRRENDLTEDTLTEDTMLLIPAVN